MPLGRAEQEDVSVASLVQSAVVVYLAVGCQISWDPETLPARSVRAVIDKIVESQ
jgi:hypothetical protein